jgi:hypothetical protein
MAGRGSGALPETAVHGAPQPAPQLQQRRTNSACEGCEAKPSHRQFKSTRRDHFLFIYQLFMPFLIVGILLPSLQL